jgi:hypothetical protein
MQSPRNSAVCLGHPSRVLHVGTWYRHPGPIIEFRSQRSARGGWVQAALDGEVVYLAPDPTISENDIQRRAPWAKSSCTPRCR